MSKEGNAIDKKQLIDKYLIDNVLEGVQEGIAILDSHGIIQKCNEKLQKILKLSKQDIVGYNIEKIMPGLKNSNFEFVNYEIQSFKKEVSIRKKVVSEDGVYFEIFFVSENHFNIELTQKYGEMKFSKEIYESILNSIDEGIHVADKNGNLIFINPAQEAMDNCKAEEVLGKRWLDVYDFINDSSLILKVLKEGKPILNIYQNYIACNGKFVSIVGSCVPLYSDGKIIGAAAITKDYVKFKEISEKILDLQVAIPHKKKHKKNQEKEEKYYSFDEILGQNQQILESIRWGIVAAKSESSVLIYGETGTGKEMFAQSIHTNSKRFAGPFLAINCAAIPENLLEGILFGTTTGVFTGAVDRMGLLEQASGGTLFLDEINSMPISLQSKLLRVIEEKKIMRLGGKKEISIDVRFISSCNLEPTEAIEKGAFRSDLFYRLAVIYLVIPPLSKRLDDLELLVAHFIQHYNKLMDKNIIRIIPQVMERFRQYSWPGNVRQLKHCIECAMNFVSKNETIIRPEHIPKYLKIFTAIDKEMKTYDVNENGNGILEKIKCEEKERIIAAIKKNNGNVARAASDLGMSRQSLHYRLKKYSLK